MRIEPNYTKPDLFSKRINCYKLKFDDLRTELRFQKYLKRKGENWKTRNLVLFIIQLLLILVYFSNYLTQLSGSEQGNSLQFQLIFVLFSFGLSILVFILMYKHGNSLSPYFSAVCYLVLSVSIILNDSEFQIILFDLNRRLALNALPGLVLVVLISSFYSDSGFFIRFWINLVVVFLFAALRISNNGRVEGGILEIILLALAASAQLVIVYFAEFNQRKDFINDKAEKHEETEKNDYFNEEISVKIKNCAEDLTNLLPHVDFNVRKDIENTVQALSVISEFRTRNNTDYNVDLVTKGLDEDDRLYIQQSWTNFQVVNIRKRERIKSKKIEKISETGISPDLLLLLKQLGFNWNIDMFDLNSKSSSQPILNTGIHAFRMFNLIKAFDIQEGKLTCFLQELQARYKLNPYHNAVHAADILSSGLYIVSTSFIQSNSTDLEMLSLIVSHLAHDVGHPGFTNRFLINFQDELALKCNPHIDNDISVLENMHSSLTFGLLREESSNFLESLEPDQLLLTRRWIIELVLATDMGKHFDLLRVFKSNNYNKSHFEVQEIRLESLKILIKASDIGHSAKRADIHRNWSLLISEEFFRQGDIEKESGKPVSMYCDRETTYVPKSQIGFLKNIALPLYESLASFLQSETFNANCLEQVKTNIQVWENEFRAERRTTLKDTRNKSNNFENLPLFHHKSEVIETCKSK